MNNTLPLQRFGFSSEKELQNVICNALCLQGVAAQTEVLIIEGLRADIITPSSVIEVKLKLNRESLFSAVGQVVTYQHHLAKPYAVILGCQADCNETIKYFRAIQPVVKVIHLQSDHLKSLRNFVNSMTSGLNFKNEALTDKEIVYSTRTVNRLINKIIGKYAVNDD